MKSFFCALLFVLPLGSTARAAGAPSEWQQRLACAGDAIRLCAHEIPDHAKIRACMIRQHDKLSERCRVVFDASIAAGE